MPATKGEGLLPPPAAAPALLASSDISGGVAGGVYAPLATCGSGSVRAAEKRV